MQRILHVNFAINYQRSCMFAMQLRHARYVYFNDNSVCLLMANKIVNKYT